MKFFRKLPLLIRILKIRYKIWKIRKNISKEQYEILCESNKFLRSCLYLNFRIRWKKDKNKYLVEWCERYKS